MANQKEQNRVVTRETATAADKVATTDEIVPSTGRYLKVTDFEGKSMIVTIKGYEIGEVGEPPKPQIQLHFEETDKVWGLNVGNRQTIECHTGSKVPFEWLGWKLRLYTTVTMFNNKKYDAIRVSDEWAEGPDAVSF